MQQKKVNKDYSITPFGSQESSSIFSAYDGDFMLMLLLRLEAAEQSGTAQNKRKCQNNLQELVL